MYSTQFMEDHNAEAIADSRNGVFLWSKENQTKTWHPHAFMKPEWFIHGTTIPCGLQMLADAKANPSLGGLTCKCFGSFLVRHCCLFLT